MEDRISKIVTEYERNNKEKLERFYAKLQKSSNG